MRQVQELTEFVYRSVRPKKLYGQPLNGASASALGAWIPLDGAVCCGALGVCPLTAVAVR